MQPDKLVAITHCIRASVLEGNWAETSLLLQQRDVLIGALAGTPLTEDQKSSLREADEAVQAAAIEKRSVLTGRIRKLGTVKKVRTAYRQDAFLTHGRTT